MLCARVTAAGTSVLSPGFTVGKGGACTGWSCRVLLEFVQYLQSLDSGSTGTRDLCLPLGPRWGRGAQGGGGVSIFGDNPLHRCSSSLRCGGCSFARNSNGFGFPSLSSCTLKAEI